ncbi:PD-(D/E)XK nuclease family protein [Phenylobacterium sp.]|uniref:PD-(D/E)XK nuclease family protein n=2 Tax=Phenylobacterium sp. TaxID=1871053 RepID=UPI002733EB60|nr:PD-(D/E)XK nuclease family protein [Phenylobacterium sp.]MDP3593566.1 PD-(D/E)XK nuclease family protein [Phenylobacterium sp.]
MEATRRHTIIAHGRLAMRELRLAAARERQHGLQIMSFEQLAVRLAGGFARPIDDESLRAAIQAVLPSTPLGELENIKLLPGMVDASADTIHKAWRAGIDLAARAGDHPRLDSIARLETAVLAQLPPGMMRPADLVAAASLRLGHAKAVLGPVEIVGITELSPCWRPLLQALTTHIPVIWTAGPRPTPAWLEGTRVTVNRTGPQTPAINAISAATAYHEAIEAVRWARSLLASGEADPADIAIAGASTAEYDDHFLSLRADANLDLHFVHGIKITTTREGQAAAALADILIRGLSQTRMRRLAALCGSDAGPFQTLPAGWMRVLPSDAPLASAAAWTRLLDRLTPADWPDAQDHTATLRGIVALLARGHTAAEEIGAALLNGRALAIWRKALLAGPSGSLEATLETLKQDDGLEACVSVAWMPASALAASPRRFVRLVGLNSARWPRGISEDRLISDHIIPTVKLDPLPVGAADRRDFETILATTERQIILSRSRRDSEGRLLGRSSLLGDHAGETYIRRNAVPTHAFSETDRLMARPQEFAHEPQAISATTCWRDWHRKEITPHDGLVRADHPLLLAILARTQSASSLKLLLRSPLGFLWKYGMRLRMPESGTDPLVLDALAMGDLVHMTLDLALQKLEAAGGLAKADENQIAAAVQNAAVEVAGVWESERAVPPAVIWRRTLDDARLLTSRALTYGDEHLPDARSYGEVAFGGLSVKSDADSPWDSATVVEIPDAGFRIAGFIDRLDISGDGKRVLVRDYKTGRPPKDNIRLDGGRELQRCLYAFAVKALLGADVSISASLLYPRDQIDLQLDDPEATLVEITGYLQAARTNLTAGNALIGPDTGGTYDDLAFALPANAGATYCKRKLSAATELFGDAAQVWEAQ